MDHNGGLVYGCVRYFALPRKPSLWLVPGDLAPLPVDLAPFVIILHPSTYPANYHVLLLFENPISALHYW